MTESNIICPSCDGYATTDILPIKFDYGSEDDRVELECEVPVRICSVCYLEFLDHETEKIKDSVVQDYLKGKDK